MVLRNSRVAVSRSLLPWLIAICASGCVSSPISNIGLVRQSVTSITISGERNLANAHVRITDPNEIERMLALIRKVRRGFMHAHVNFDVENAEVLRIRIASENGPTDLTMVSGMMPVPGNEDGLFYDPGSEAQSELWDLALARLEAGNSQ